MLNCCAYFSNMKRARDHRESPNKRVCVPLEHKSMPSSNYEKFELVTKDGEWLHIGVNVENHIWTWVSNYLAKNAYMDTKRRQAFVWRAHNIAKHTFTVLCQIYGRKTKGLIAIDAKPLASAAVFFTACCYTNDPYTIATFNIFPRVELDTRAFFFAVNAICMVKFRGVLQFNAMECTHLRTLYKRETTDEHDDGGKLDRVDLVRLLGPCERVVARKCINHDECYPAPSAIVEIDVYTKLQRSTHPGTAFVPQLLGVYVSNVATYLLMKFYPLTTSNAQKIIREKQKWIQQTWKRIVLGVAALHSLGCAHRDLKPCNILWHQSISSEIPMPVIADFGLASVVQSKKRNTHPIVTYTTRAPEAFAKTRKYNSFALDVWSLGCLLGWLAHPNGELPFATSGDHAEDVSHKIIRCHANGKFDVDLNLSDDGMNMLWKCVHLDPKQRITIAEIQRHPYWTS